MALGFRGIARGCLGRRGWREDFDRAIALAQTADPRSRAAVTSYKYSTAVPNGVLLPDDAALRDIEEARNIAEQSGDDMTVGITRLTMGLSLVHRDTPTDREAGSKMLSHVREMCQHKQFFLTFSPILDVYVARERASRGDYEGAVPVLRAAVSEFRNRGQLSWCPTATGLFVETLLDRGADGDMAEALAAAEQLATKPAGDELAISQVWLLRVGALLARARGDDGGYSHYRNRYRAMATSLGFEGHIAWAAAMP